METHNIEGAKVKSTVDKTNKILKIKTSYATFSLKPIKGTIEQYHCQVTALLEFALFKRSGPSSFGMFHVSRFPGRNSVQRPKNLNPLHGNAVLMWPNLSQIEKSRCLEYVEKMIREHLPRIPLEAK